AGGDDAGPPGVGRAPGGRRGGGGVALAPARSLALYSCFPTAPPLSAAMLGMAPDDPRPLTAAGGLPWFGGPGNNYTTHAIAALVERLRADGDGIALVHSLGWNLTKHALGIDRGRPPPRAWPTPPR